MSAELLPAIQPKHIGCLCCGGASPCFNLDREIEVGFGAAFVSRDGNNLDPTPRNGHEAEAIAANDPDHDWRIGMYGPLRGELYQRHAAGNWALIEENKGFA